MPWLRKTALIVAAVALLIVTYFVVAVISFGTSGGGLVEVIDVVLLVVVAVVFGLCVRLLYRAWRNTSNHQHHGSCWSSATDDSPPAERRTDHEAPH